MTKQEKFWLVVVLTIVLWMCCNSSYRLGMKVQKEYMEKIVPECVIKENYA